MFSKKQSGFISQMLTVLLAGLLVLSACSPAVSATSLPNPTVITALMATLVLTATIASAATVVPTPDGSLHLSLDTGNIATGFQIETVAAASDGDSAFYWEMLSEYIRVTQQGYSISIHSLQPQIFIYSVKELGEVNEVAS